VAQGGQPIVSNDISKDGRFLRDAVVEAGFRGMVCLPLISGENLMGVLSVFRRGPERLDARGLDHLTAVGRWAGLAIENARLHNNARRLAVLEERERIGMDLHDGIIQSIYAVGLTLEHARLLMGEDTLQAHARIEQAIEDLNNTIRDIRAYILDLRPRQLHNENLMMGLQRLATEFRANTLQEISLKGQAEKLLGLPEPQAVALFHICQESLANIAKHAHSRHVDVVVWTTHDRVLMEIRDDGQGFDLAKVKMSLGHGLANIQTRAHNVGGDVDISSEPGSGTTILAWVPYRK
jgi:signal transduction histidine kinase